MPRIQILIEADVSSQLKQDLKDLVGTPAFVSLPGPVTVCSVKNVYEPKNEISDRFYPRDTDPIEPDDFPERKTHHD